MNHCKTVKDENEYLNKRNNELVS